MHNHTSHALTYTHKLEHTNTSTPTYYDPCTFARAITENRRPLIIRTFQSKIDPNPFSSLCIHDARSAFFFNQRLPYFLSFLEPH